MISLSPDGRHYLRAALGVAVPKPYSARWLLPRLIGPDPDRWVSSTIYWLLCMPLMAWTYFGAMGLGGATRWFATALLCALPGVWRCSWRFPVLIDAPSFGMALGVATAAMTLPWWASMPLALVLGATRESGPVFAALWSWSPSPLVGLLASGWWRPHAMPDASAEPWLEHPVRYALALRRQIGLDSSLYLRPWGAALAGLAAPSWQLAATVAAAHMQLFCAVDTIRLTSWCAPVLVAAAAKTIPPAWWALALLVTLVQRDERV